MIAARTQFLDLQPDVDLSLWSAYDRHWCLEFTKASRSRKIRTIEEWAEDEVTIPTGPYEGLRFKLDRQPVAILLYREFANPHWREFAITGSTQTGKSFLGFALPVCYTLCEKREDVIIAAPTKEILEDKVKRDIYPILERSKYKDIIPTTGGGSKGGVPDRIDMRNGTTLKLMSFEGGDKSKASFTCPNIFMTEVDGSRAQSTSMEAGPIEQIKARARATDRESRFILYECTVSTPEGNIWQLTQKKGSAAQIMLPCPHCGQWSRPDREHLKGWENAKTEIEAEDLTAWHCAKCDHPWTEEERRAANQPANGAKLLHRGQTIDKNGCVQGKLPDTRLLGFRFSAVNNLFLPAKDIGVDCWNVLQDEDDLDGEKKLTQFVFALPYVPPGLDVVKIDRERAEQRTLQYTQGAAPKATKWITIGVDVGKFDCWWTCIAWMLPERIGLIMDYGRIRLRMEHNGVWGNADDFGFDTIFDHRMDAWKAGVDQGWPNSDGEVLDYDALWIDSRWQGDEPDAKVVYDAIRRWGDRRVLPVMGHSSNSMSRISKYRAPRITQKDVVRTGNEYHIIFNQEPQVSMHRVHINSDAWKTITQRRITKEIGSMGSLMLYHSKHPRQHATFVKHLDSEYVDRHFEPGKGDTQQWVVKRRANHYLDATVYACAAGHYAGFRVRPENEKKKRQSNARPRTATQGRGGRAFVASQR